jgi:uncharacterized protein (UPF0335 family)
MASTEHARVVNQEALTRGVDRIVALMNDRDAISGDIKTEIEALKEAGFVPKHVRTVVRETRMEADERADMYLTLDNYRRGLGILADTPLGEAAMSRAAQERPTRPRTFAEQPVHRLRRPGRPRKNGAAPGHALSASRRHLDGDDAPLAT